MRKQDMTVRIVDGKISAEIHAESLEYAIEMLAELADAICTQATKMKLMPSKEVCGTLLGYVLAERYMTDNAVAVLAEALEDVEGVESWIS